MVNKKQVVFYGVWRGEALPDAVMDERFRWLLSHLAAPNGRNGREVCPWAIFAFREGRFCLGDARGYDSDNVGLNTIVEEMIMEYAKYGAFYPTNPSPYTLTVLLADETRAEPILDALAAYRPKLTPRGLMLGALDPFNRLQSLSGGKGCPYVSPWKFLTIRWMVKGDYVFLNLNSEYRDIYIKFFGTWPETG